MYLQTAAENGDLLRQLQEQENNAMMLAKVGRARARANNKLEESGES